MDTYQLLPPLAGDDLSRLKASIAERGVQVPVVVDEDGAIIDGHNRAMVADSLGIEYATIVRPGLAPHEKRLLAVELNLARRHLTDAQKTQLGRAIEPDIAERARLRQEALGRSHGDDPSGQLSGRGETREEVAKAVGLPTGKTYQRHKALLEEAERIAPELIQDVEAGDMTMKELKRKVKERHAEAEPEAAKPKPTPKKSLAVTPMANVPPDVRRVSQMAHDVIQRVRALRSRHAAGQMALGIEGGIFAGELETLRDELDGFVQELRAAVAPPSGGQHDRTAS